MATLRCGGSDESWLSLPVAGGTVAVMPPKFSRAASPDAATGVVMRLCPSAVFYSMTAKAYHRAVMPT